MTEQVQNYNGEYLGGHSMYAKKRSVVLSIYPREVAVDSLEMHIPFSSIKEVKNVNESNMKALRVIAFGVVGALWKKKETYLCLVYNDGVQEQNPVFKLDDLDKAQREIYQRVIHDRKTPDARECTKVCSSCGKTVKAGTNLCMYCGGKLKEVKL